jgi:uncharacterized protein (TIGR00297 family)
MSPVLAAAVSLVVSLVAWQAGALTRSGAVAALAVGTAVLFGTGWPGAGVLAAFFVGSTLAGRAAVHRGLAADPAAERRNARQVLANGAVAGVGALLERSLPGLGFWGMTTALAAASADTWATSIGAFSAADPRHLLSGRTVPRGTSGGVSLIGTFGALGGAVLVALTGALGGGGVPLLVGGSTIGFVGMLLDSLLGATVQDRPLRGVQWLDNDGVNFLATAFAGLAGALVWWALGHR